MMWIALWISLDRLLLAGQRQATSSKILETASGQFLALIAFFAFPIIQYLLLKRFSKREGSPELWYLPDYGFRLVIRNLPRRHTLSEIKHRALIRKFVAAGAGASVATIQDEVLIEKEDFFLFAGTDQVLINFQIRGEHADNLVFVMTDKLGNERKSERLDSFDRLICDYVALLNNRFNFNIKLERVSKIGSASNQVLMREAS